MTARRRIAWAVLTCLTSSCAVVLGIEDVPFVALEEAGVPHAPDAPDRGEDRETPEPIPDAREEPRDTSPPPERDATRDACPTRAATNTDGLSSCEERVDGKYCGSSTQLNPKTGAYPNKEDLVLCSGGRIVTTKPCKKCIPMPPTHSDECDPCGCLPNGFYCGRDIEGWNAVENSNIQIRCTDGVASSPRACATCTSGAQSACP